MFKSSYLFILSVVLSSHKANDSVAEKRQKWMTQYQTPKMGLFTMTWLSFWRKTRAGILNDKIRSKKSSPTNQVSWYWRIEPLYQPC